MLKLLAVAHALEPSNVPPPPPRDSASLEWVAARLEAFCDRLERAKGLPPSRRIEPAPWPANPGPQQPAPYPPPRPPRPPQHRPSPALGAVAARARQLESLLTIPPAAPLPAIPIHIDDSALDDQQRVDVGLAVHPADHWCGANVEPRTEDSSSNKPHVAPLSQLANFSTYLTATHQDRREELPISPFTNIGTSLDNHRFYASAISPASEPIPSPMEIDPISTAARSDAASHQISEPSTLGLKALNGVDPTPSIGHRVLSATSSLGAAPLPKLPSGLDLPMDSFRSRGNSSATNLDANSSFQSRASGGRARLHADYDKIYNRPSDAPPPEDESQIKIAGGDLFVEGRVQDRWALGRKIGEGGFSTVYKAARKRHPRYDHHQCIPDACAIKVITKRPEPFNRRMVEREVFSYRLLEMVGGHENIVKLYEVSEDDDKVYLVMELLEGGELFSRIAERGLYTEKDAANLVVSMLASLCFCHRFNLTHRDVKPENFVFLKKAGNHAELKLTDFGIAHYSEDPEAVCKTMCGTPLYIAPEVLFRQPYGAEADLWSLGVIVYIMLVGYPPFHDQDMVQLVKKIKYKPVAFEGAEWSLISEHGKNFLLNLLDKDKSNRMTAQQALEHEWLKNNCQLASRNVLEVAQMNIKSFATRKRWKAAAGTGSKALNKGSRMVDATGAAAISDDHSGATNSDRQSHAGLVGDDGDFTVATEDTLAESDLGSLWQRLRRDRVLQPRRPRSRTSSRFAASRDRAARLDAVSSPLPAADGWRRISDEGRTSRLRQQRCKSADLATSAEALTSSVSSVDPVSAGRRRERPPAPAVEPRQRIGQLWRTRRERAVSQISEPSHTPLEAKAARTHQSHHHQHQQQQQHGRSRFRFFRS